MESAVEDFDSIDLEVDKDSTLLSQDDCHFYLQNKSQIYEVNEFGLVNTYSLPECCYYVKRKGPDIYFGSRNKLYKLLKDETFVEKKFRQRIIGFLPLDSEYPLLALICKDIKTLHLQINDKYIVLEKYSERVDASVYYLEYLADNLVLCVYKTQNVVKYCMVAVDETDMVLLRKEVLIKGEEGRFYKAIMEGYFFLITEKSIRVMSYDKLHYCLDLSGVYTNPGSNVLTLVNERILCMAGPDREKVAVHFKDVVSEEVFKTLAINFGAESSVVLAMICNQGLFKLLVKSGDSKLSVVSFQETVETESISSYDPNEKNYNLENSSQRKEFHYQLIKSINSSEVIITRKLIDYILKNKLESCMRKLIRCPHIPESESVRLLNSDLSLLEDFIMHAKGSEEEFKRAFRKEIEADKFKVILVKLLEMVLTREEQDREFTTKAVTMINCLLDAKIMEIKEFDEDILKKLETMVEGCQKEHLDLQSLLSVTNTLLNSKPKYNSNPLITEIDITLE